MLARVDFTLVLGRVNVAELFDVVRGHNAVAHVGHDHRPVLEAFDAVHRRAVHLVFAWVLLARDLVGGHSRFANVCRPTGSIRGRRVWSRRRLRSQTR